ncbi:uncharacterized protein LOC135706631 [Ochlerotatus camptorhynchus]|uniref:uncharacterized protein LOC135706631 n=1 Tax=Ochlerotatus camptorhynchus TaxID=644619 RepID=UPI0031D67C33
MPITRSSTRDGVQDAGVEQQQGNPSPSDGSGSFHGFDEWEADWDEATAKKYRGLVRQRSQAKMKLVRINRTLINETLGLAQLGVLSKNLAVTYAEYSQFHSKVIALVPDEALDGQDDEYASFEKLYYDVSNAVEELLLEAKARATPKVPQAIPAAPHVIIQQQPLKAPIPTFDGSYDAWPKFKAIFQDLMANSGDTNAIKLYHLDKALIGDATGVLDAKLLSEGNYEQAWTILTDRYENKRVIVETHIRGLLFLKKMTSESHKELRTLLNEATHHVESLRYLQQQITGVSEHIIVYLIISALDKSTRKSWEGTQKKGDLLKYSQVIEFLKSRCQILENCEAAFQSVPPTIKPKQAQLPSRVQPQKSHAVSTNASQACEICGGDHRNFQCTALNNLTASQKNEKIRAAGVCFNCLRKGHRSKNCPSIKTCHKCQRRHHTLLHDDGAPTQEKMPNISLSAESMAIPPPVPAAPSQPSTSVQKILAPVEHPVSTTCSSNFAQSTKTVLLLTAVVQLFDKKSHPHPCRVLLDSGSQVNFVTEDMANRLGLPKKPANVSITGINALRTLARDKVTLKFKSRVSNFQASLECLVTPKVTGTIPSSKININNWDIPAGVVLADPEFHTPDKVDLLIGAELFFDILKPSQLNLADNLPQLRDTHLGWIVSGVIVEPQISNVSVQHASHVSLEDIERKMYKFWQIEEVPDVPKLSTEEMACEAHFLSTYQRDESGRFIVSLPFNENSSQLDDCRALALKRFLMLEKRLMNNPELQAQYVEFVREYEVLGHCREINEADDPPNQQRYYLPHHAVLRPSSSSTKCRVVFDASAKSSSEKLSLNEVLQVGPVVQNDLHFIVLRFRKFKIAFSGDVAKMYRQVLQALQDRRFLRIFWRPHPSQKLRVLELCTVTYGTASAPYLATRCLVQLVEEEGEFFPIASRIVKEETYMDDVLSGADSVEDAIEAQQQLKQLLGRGGFPIHKWCSNSKEFLERIPVEDQEKRVPLEERDVNEAIKVLGLLWDPNADTLYIANHPKLPPPLQQRVTKRVMYSEIAKFFDPLGLVSPVIVLAKLMAQRLWQLKVGWDDPIDEDTAQKWQELQASLSHLHNIAIPRCVTFQGVVAFELHGFSDASTVAYGACIYLRSLFNDGSAKLRLLTSKSKLAPLHDLSIPRKELCAALLLIRLVLKVLPALDMEFREIVLWCDSTIVLAWIKKPLNQLLLFVRNRIAVIQEHTGGFRWEYVRSLQNPADIVSRGQLPGALENNNLWWNGPEFLQRVKYDIDPPEEVPDSLLPELKPVIVTAAVSMEPFPFFSRYSSFRKIQRVMGYVLRFVGNCRMKNPAERKTNHHLMIPELRQATEAIIHVVQFVHLADEIQRVVAHEPCKKLANLRPIYTDGLLRVGGRLDRSQLPFESRHPIILPDKDPVVRLLIRQMHIEQLHVGQSGLMNAMRQRYWLLNARSTIRQITRKCVRCFRINPTNTSQLMGNLPASRVVPSPPFAVTGVDYAGPFLIKQGVRRPALVKSYVAVFVCMTTKAVHLEAVSDLSTDAFLASLKRFLGRRGMIQQLHSDNATNFRGANNELNALFQQFRDQQAVNTIEKFCRNREIEWHFIPPDAPEFGGLWEAAVKSAKSHLKRIVGNVKLTFEELSTVLVEIEAVLNSRPLFTISNDPADPLVITPAHYLIGRPLTAIPEPSLEDVKAARLTRWQHLQLMREHFWRAWSRDYLNTLQPRKKNLRTTPNIRENMVVLLHDRNQPPLNWKLGRIIAVYPGDDGLVRTVDVVAGGSSYRRPINKISVLPIEDNVQPPGNC